jgi:hypothetical protein
LVVRNAGNLATAWSTGQRDYPKWLSKLNDVATSLQGRDVFLAIPLPSSFRDIRTSVASEAHVIHSTNFENELRVATMNWVAPGCLNPDGSPQTEKQKTGLVYSPDRPGILVSTRLAELMKEVRTAPGTSDWHYNLIGLLIRNARIPCPVVRSEHENP